MKLTTLKQYADEKHISYEAIRRQVVKYRKDLGDHITKKDGTQFLDEFAVEFLDGKRRASPVVVMQEERQDQIDFLTKQVEELRRQLESAREKIVELTLQKGSMEAAQSKYQLLLEVHEDTKKAVEEAKAEIKEARAETAEIRERLRQTEIENAEALTDVREQLHEVKAALTIAEHEAQSYHKSIFGFYRKR